MTYSKFLLIRFFSNFAADLAFDTGYKITPSQSPHLSGTRIDPRDPLLRRGSFLAAKAISRRNIHLRRYIRKKFEFRSSFLMT